MRIVHPTTQNALPRANRVTRGDLFTSIFHYTSIETYKTYINQRLDFFTTRTFWNFTTLSRKTRPDSINHIQTNRYHGPKIHQHTSLCLTRRQQHNALLAPIVLASSNALTIAAAIPTATPASNRAATEISG